MICKSIKTMPLQIDCFRFVYISFLHLQYALLLCHMYVALNNNKKKYYCLTLTTQFIQIYYTFIYCNIKNSKLLEMSSNNNYNQHAFSHFLQELLQML